MSRVIPCGMVYNMILKCSKARSGKVDRKIRDKYKSIIKQTTQIYTPEHNKNCLFKNVVDIDFNDAYCGVLRTFPCPYSLPASKPYENMDNVKIYLIKYTNLKTNDSWERWTYEEEYLTLLEHYKNNTYEIIDTKYLSMDKNIYKPVAKKYIEFKEKYGKKTVLPFWGMFAFDVGNENSNLTKFNNFFLFAYFSMKTKCNLLKIAKVIKDNGGKVISYMLDGLSFYSNDNDLIIKKINELKFDIKIKKWDNWFQHNQGYYACWNNVYDYKIRTQGSCSDELGFDIKAYESISKIVDEYKIREVN